MQLCRASFIHFKACMGMAVAEVISKTFHKQNEASQKEILLWKRRLLNYLQRPKKKPFGAPVPRKDCNNNHVKQKGRALLPPLQQAFSCSFPKKRCDFLTTLPQHLRPLHIFPLYFLGSRTTKAFPSCSLPKLLQHSVLEACPWALPLAVRSHLPIQPMYAHQNS